MPRITDLEAFEHSYITDQEFANDLTLHENTIRKWIKAGVLPAYRYTREWRIAKVDAIAFIERSRLRV